MTVYRIVPLFTAAGEVHAMQQQRGEYRLNTDVVRLPNGDVCSDRGWHWTPSEAWEAAAAQLDSLAERLRVQAEACRTRATEEACS